MKASQTRWPRRWLMTDERLGARLWDAVNRLTDGESGIVFRHYSLNLHDREALGRELAKACRKRGIRFAVARDPALAAKIGADLVHNPAGPTDLPFSLAVHSIDEALHAERRGAALVFISPIHATRSHRGAWTLGAEGATRLAKAAGVPAIALGGMNEDRFAELPGNAFHGWAGIDAWVSDAAD